MMTQIVLNIIRTLYNDHWKSHQLKTKTAKIAELQNVPPEPHT